MAGTIKSKSDLYADSAALPAPITRAALITHLDNMVASYENIIQEYTTAARNGLTPVQGQKIFNTTNKRLEIYSGTAWLPCSQKEAVTLDASSNPNYPQGGVGDLYTITVAGKVGGAGGKSVYVGDLVYCISENAGGTEASVGTSWKVCYSNDASNVPTRYAEISLSSAEILALNTTPKEIVAAPGAGKIIVVEEVVYNFTYNSIAYATNTVIALRNPTGTEDAAFSIAHTSNYIEVEEMSGHKVISNEKLEVYALTGDPTTGNSTMTIGVYYKIHTL